MHGVSCCSGQVLDSFGMMHSAMEVSSCGAFNPCTNHHAATLSHSLFEFRRPCQILGAGQRKCRSRLFAVDDGATKRDSWKPQAHLLLSGLSSGEITLSPSIRTRHKTCQSGSLIVCAAQNHSNESSDEKDSGNKNFMDAALQSTDWRAFRARLIANERATEEDDEEDQEPPSTSDAKSDDNLLLGTRWAHPILKPEAGCVLIATDKLDELSIFERTVIILLSAGSNKKNEGPFGLILNRPLPHVLKDIRPQDQVLAEAFGESQVHFGGPLVSDLILLLQAASARKGYQEVVPGIFYSSAEGLDQAVSMIKEKASAPEDIRFFFGYAGWATGQLEREVEDGYWYVAACSTNLFISSSSVDLWVEVLKLMGGQYAELSKKPKKRWFNSGD